MGRTLVLHRMPLAEAVYGASKECTEELLQALETGQLEKVKELLEQETHVDCVDENFLTPLLLASKNGYIEVVSELIAKRAKVDHRDSDEGFSALTWASHNGHAEIVTLLLENGAPVNHKDDFQSTPLTWACYKGFEEVVQALLQKGANVNYVDGDDTFPLYLASYKGHAAVVKLLLLEQHNVNVNQKLHERTSLWSAAQQGHLDVVTALLEKEADTNEADRSITPLMICCEYGHQLVALALIEAGAVVDATDDYGWTALMYAAENGYEKVVRVLINNGANPFTKNKTRTTALDLALGRQHRSVIDFISPFYYISDINGKLVSDDGKNTFTIESTFYGEQARIYAEALQTIREVGQQEARQQQEEKRKVDIFYTKLAGHAFTTFIFNSELSEERKKELLEKIKTIFSNPHTWNPTEMVTQLKELLFTDAQVSTDIENEIKQHATELYERFKKEKKVGDTYDEKNPNSLISKEKYKDMFATTFSPLTDSAQTPAQGPKTKSRQGIGTPTQLFSTS